MMGDVKVEKHWIGRIIRIRFAGRRISGVPRLCYVLRGEMEHSDFRIGMEFLTGAGRWRVTDIGTRTIIAIKLDQSDPSNYDGPPYAVVETVFDEYDFGGCEPTESS